MKRRYIITLFALTLLFCHASFAQGIRGLITDEAGEPLPYASIYVKEAGTGTSSNVDGLYELRLPPGNYKVTYQFLGFAAQTKTVNIASGFTQINIALKEQSVVLNTVEVSAGAEDPAYTIMRKAISKAKYHLLQTDSYSAQVYTKGTGGLKKIPWIFRKALEEEGIDTNRVFTSESVSEIYFERPNTFKEKIVSVRVSGEKDNNANPNAYINSSFYLPFVVGGVSPISPKAFAYYRFVYLGSFEDRGFVINKIQVIPRSRGDNVFEGEIYIRENYWNIHSLALKTKIEAFDMTVSQIFGPVTEDIWMPVTQKYKFAGSFLGAEIEFDYLASVSNYVIVANKDLNAEITVLDENIEAIPDAVAEANVEKSEVKSDLKEEDKKVTRKQLAKMIDEYESQELEEKEMDKNIVSNTWYSIDSTAKKKDSVYWANIRPVPLTEKEITSYAKDDSVYVAEIADSTKKSDGGSFRFGTIFFGDTYKIGEKSKFKFNGLLPEFRFNTVEGFNLDLAGTFTARNDSGLVFFASPNVRYGFSSEQFYGKLNTGFSFGESEQRSTIALEGGKYIEQFYTSSINPLINSLWSLFFARNYMKLYDKEYLALNFEKQMSHAYSFAASAEIAERNELYNNTLYSFFRPGENWYTVNSPINAESVASGFTGNRAFKTAMTFTAKPWLKYRLYNGKKLPIENSSPELMLTYNAGWKGVYKSTTDFQQIELGIKDEFSIGVRATVDFNLQAGTFISSNNLAFMDFKHFNGGLTEIAPLNVTGNYRLLDYYLYSTQKSYISLISYVHFRKFLVTQIPLVRISGVKENLFVNYLKTDFSPNYVEVGYAIDNIFRFFRLEFVQSFNDLTPYQFGVRIGVASFIKVN